MVNHPELKRIMRIGTTLAERGWAEANAGNMSVRINSFHGLRIPGNHDVIVLDEPFPELNGQWFIVTATGSRARDIERVPAETIGMYEMIEEGSSVRRHWGAFPPTSEFPAHLAVYSKCVECRPGLDAVLHTHPPYLIAMSHLPEMQEPGSLNRTLRAMHPEVGILVPEGIVSMEFKIPGSVDLGHATGEAMTGANIAIWPMHGIVSVGPDLDKALDQVEIIEKAARIYMISRASGAIPVGLSDEQVSSSREFWGIESPAG